MQTRTNQPTELKIFHKSKDHTTIPYVEHYIRFKKYTQLAKDSRQTLS